MADKIPVLTADDARDNALINSLSIIGIDVKTGLSHLSNKKSVYCGVVNAFYLHFQKLCALISDSLAENDLDSFRLAVHTMKSALSTIGAMDLSKQAAGLEAAAKNGDAKFCAEQYPWLNYGLLALYGRLSAVFGGGKDTAMEKGNLEMLRESVGKAMQAVAVYNSKSAINALGPLLAYDFGEEINTSLENAVEAFSDCDIDVARDLLTALHTHTGII